MLMTMTLPQRINIKTNKIWLSWSATKQTKQETYSKDEDGKPPWDPWFLSQSAPTKAAAKKLDAAVVLVELEASSSSSALGSC